MHGLHRMELGCILVATDFSEHSEVAERLAVAVAASHDASVVLLHVDPVPETLTGETAMEGVRPELWRQYRESSRRLVDARLADAIDRLRRWAPHVVIRPAVDYGDVAAALASRARAGGAGLIAIGSHGAAASERYLFGSVLAALLPSAPCPLLVTRASQRDRVGEARGFVRPLVAVDYSRFAEPAARLGRALAAPSATIELLHVWRAPLVLTEDGGAVLTEADRRDLDAAAALALARERARLEGFRDRALGGADAHCVVEPGRVASVVLEQARVRGCDLIVVGAHGGGAGDGVGSVTDRVLRHSPVPVLYVPPSAMAEPRLAAHPDRHVAARS